LIDRIFVDTNPLIYLLDNVQPFVLPVKNFLLKYKNLNAEFYTSTITDAEFFVKPIEENKLDKIALYRSFFSNFGFINTMLQALDFEPINFLGNGNWFRTIVIWSDVWKNFGFGTIVYLASIIAINPNLYDAAKIDGASKLQQIWHVTLPGMASIIVLMATLSLGRVLSAGFDQIYNMYNPLVYSHADIIDTYVYRIGLEGMQFGFAAAVGLFQSVISCILIIVSYFLADKYANYRIF